MLQRPEQQLPLVAQLARG
ncbi:hypothetical protein VCHC47A1_2640, partial [Vibrio cholerae HC-47A1]